MKPFSFTNISPARHMAITRWLRISSLITTICIVLLVCISVPEYLLSKNNALHHKELQRATSARASATALDPNVQLAVTKIEARQRKAKNSVALLKHIQSVCKEDSTLESLQIKPHSIQITLAAKNTNTLMTMADTLAQQPPYKGMYISSLEPKEQRMIATLKSQELKNS